MLLALDRPLVAPQRIVQLSQQAMYRGMTDRVSALSQFRGNGSKRFRRPLQQSHGITCRSFSHQQFQVIHKGRIHFFARFTSSARTAGSFRHLTQTSRLQLLDPAPNRALRQTQHFRHKSNAAMSQSHGFLGSVKPRLPLVEKGHHFDPPAMRSSHVVIDDTMRTNTPLKIRSRHSRRPWRAWLQN